MRSSGFITTLLVMRIMSIRSQIYYTLPPLEGKGTENSYHSPAYSTDSPRGIFHFSDTDNTFDTNFKVPDFEALDPIKMASDLMRAAASAENRRKTRTGIYLPLPFVGKPLNFEMKGESRSGLSLREGETTKDAEKDETDLTPEAREAYFRAKHICLHSSTASCDEALDTFHRVRFGTSLMESVSSHVTLDEDPTTSFAKMFVPALGEKLEALEKDITSASSKEDSNTSQEDDSAETSLREPASHHDVYSVRDQHPFSKLRYPPAQSRSNMTKIRDFLERITHGTHV